MHLRKKLKSGGQNSAYSSYVKLVYQILVSSNLLGLHSFLRHFQKKFTRNLYAKGLFMVVYNQFTEERPDMDFFSEFTVY